MKFAGGSGCGEVLWLLGYGQDVEGRTTSFLGRNGVVCVKNSVWANTISRFGQSIPLLIYRVWTNSRITDTRCNRTDCTSWRSISSLPLIVLYAYNFANGYGNTQQMSSFYTTFCAQTKRVLRERVSSTTTTIVGQRTIKLATGTFI
jgi:hypothetical protein